jgi:hypothetical protein
MRSISPEAERLTPALPASGSRRGPESRRSESLQSNAWPEGFGVVRYGLGGVYDDRP